MSPLLSTLANASALGYRSLAAGAATSFESIATVSVGSGGASSIDFTSIPNTYKHLQIRFIARNNQAVTSDFMNMKFNGTGSGLYRTHQLSGDGSSAAAADFGAINQIYINRIPGTSATSNVFGGIILDILDYADTNKFKTSRSLGGFDANGSGLLYFMSGLWRSTDAITDIAITPGTGNFLQYSHFALYGIKGA